MLSAQFGAVQIWGSLGAFLLEPGCWVKFANERENVNFFVKILIVLQKLDPTDGRRCDILGPGIEKKA